jgi:cold-inducible RNA-binding protein
MKNLFVGNMSFQTTEGDLRTLFEPYGEITRIHIVQDRDTGQARGFAFVEVADDAEAAKAISALNGKEVAGRALKVNEATPRPERSGGGSRGGGGGGFRDRGDRGRGGRYWT